MMPCSRTQPEANDWEPPYRAWLFGLFAPLAKNLFDSGGPGWKQLDERAAKNFREHINFGVIHPAQTRFYFGQTCTADVPPRDLQLGGEDLLRKLGCHPQTTDLRANEIL